MPPTGTPPMDTPWAMRSPAGAAVVEVAAVVGVVVVVAVSEPAAPLTEPAARAPPTSARPAPSSANERRIFTPTSVSMLVDSGTRSDVRRLRAASFDRRSPLQHGEPPDHRGGVAVQRAIGVERHDDHDAAHRS